MKKAAVVLAVALAVFTACQSPKAVPRQEASYPTSSVELVAPAGSGGGYDLTIRAVARCLEKTGLVSVPLPVTNKPGMGGGVALDYLYEKLGCDDVVAVYSPPLCLINLNGSSERSYKDSTTPIARLITDYGCFAVSKDSPYQTIAEVMEVLRNDPSSLRIGGTSAAGSMDHVQFLKIAKAAEVTGLDKIQYTGYQDGAVVAQLMGGNIDVVSTGISDAVGLAESGDIRVLAITADKRVGSGIVAEMPTCVEQGINATFINWRGLFGPKDMPEYASAYWEDVLKKMAESDQWKEMCIKYGWDMDFMAGAEFEIFLEQVNAEYADLLEEVGLIDSEASSIDR